MMNDSLRMVLQSSSNLCKTNLWMILDMRNKINPVLIAIAANIDGGNFSY